MSCGDGRPDLMGEHPAAKGIAAMRGGDFAAALAHFDELIRREPNGVPGHFLRTEALDRAGERQKAREALLALVPRFPFAEGACRERLALLSLRENDVDAAIASLRRALACGWSNAGAITADPAFAAHASNADLLAVLDDARKIVAT